MQPAVQDEIRVTLSASGPRYVSPNAEFAVWSATLGEGATASSSRSPARSGT